MKLSRILICVLISFSLRCIASAAPPICPRQSNPFILDTFLSPSPPFSKISPREVNGDTFERVTGSKTGNLYTSVLFYASWCPFSYNAQSNFEVLSSIFPQIEHLQVEQSSAMPSLFSRYDIHSLPAIFLMNGTSTLQYHGSKDVASLILFYTRTTGLEPVSYVNYAKDERSENEGNFIMQTWIGLSAKEMLKREPYLVFAVLFLCLRLVIYAFPKVLNHIRGIWVLYTPRLNLEIFGETSQILVRVKHMIDVKRVWNKIRFCKSRNFHEGARNARVWASSFTSVALGKTPFSR